MLVLTGGKPASEPFPEAKVKINLVREYCVSPENLFLTPDL
jgi:hypothetical protein